MSLVGDDRWGGRATSTRSHPSLSQTSPPTMRSEPPPGTKSSGSRPHATEPSQDRLEKLESSHLHTTAHFERRLQNLQQLVEDTVEQRLSKLEVDVATATNRYRGMITDVLAMLDKRIHGLHRELGANTAVVREQGVMIGDIRASVEKRLQSFSRIDNLRRELQGSAAKPDRAEPSQDLEMVQQQLRKLESAVSACEHEHRAMRSEVFQELAVRDSLMDNLTKCCEESAAKAAAKPDRTEFNPDMEMVQQRLQKLESTVSASEQEHRTMTSEIPAMFNQCLQSLQQELAMRDSLIQHALESRLSINLNTEEEEEEEQEDAAEQEQEEVAAPTWPRTRDIDRLKCPESPGSLSTGPGSPEESEASEGRTTPLQLPSPLPSPRPSLRASEGNARGVREDDDGGVGRRVRFTVPEMSPTSRPMEASPRTRSMPALAMPAMAPAACPRGSSTGRLPSGAEAPTQGTFGAGAPKRGSAPRGMLFQG